MSIDFTGVTGIEDDYGNVTKITDASGNVMWSAVPPETTLIIRTVGDCRFKTATKYPTDAASYSSLVNEEIADDDATYIKLGATGTMNSSGKSYDGIYLADIVDIPKGEVVSGYLFVRAYRESNTSMRASLSFDGGGFLTSSYMQAVEAYEDITMLLPAESISSINEYISQNQKMPAFYAYFEVTCSAPKTAYVRITQVYLSLTFKGR